MLVTILVNFFLLSIFLVPSGLSYSECTNSIKHTIGQYFITPCLMPNAEYNVVPHCLEDKTKSGELLIISCSKSDDLTHGAVW